MWATPVKGGAELLLGLRALKDALVYAVTTTLTQSLYWISNFRVMVHKSIARRTLPCDHMRASNYLKILTNK